MSPAMSAGRGCLATAALVAIAGLVCAPPTLRTDRGVQAAVRPRYAAQSGPTCAWSNASIGAQDFGNYGWIDTQGLYLLTRFPAMGGNAIRIRGTFPYARYMSIAVYSARLRVVIDHLTDQSIVADPGSTNPFLPYANRHARRRAYTVYLRPGPVPAQNRAPNTVYMGPDGPIVVLYRVYAPDVGADPYGNVAKPSLDIVDGRSNAITPMSMCATVLPLRWQTPIKLAASLRWWRVGAAGKGGTNADDTYLVARLNQGDSDMYIVRFKAPSFDNTYLGSSITGHQDVRLWSLCQYNMVSEAVIGCLHDYQAVLDRSGFVTIVVSTAANRPTTATPANGVNWLPFGRGPIGMLMYREVLPNPSFAYGLQVVAPGSFQYEMQRVLKSYLPNIQPCSRTGYTPDGCSDQVNPLTCSDLTEPVPCNGPPGTTRVAVAVTHRTGQLSSPGLLHKAITSPAAR